MLIAIPIDDKEINSRVSISFGRTPYFLIYNTLSNSSNIIKNNAATAQGGAGIKAAQIIADANVDILITPRCGENAVQVLKEAKIKLYKAINDIASDNIEAFMNNNLENLCEIHPGLHKHTE